MFWNDRHLCCQDSGTKTKTSYSQRIEQKEVELEKKKQEVDQRQEMATHLQTELERLKNAQKDIVEELRTSKDKARPNYNIFCACSVSNIVFSIGNFTGVVSGSGAHSPRGDTHKVQGHFAATEARQ